MHRTAFHRGQRHPLAPAALLLLALCLLTAGVQAANETANTRMSVAGDGLTIDGIVPTPTVTPTPTTTVCAYADSYPMPNFKVDRTSGPAPLTVQFTDMSSEWAYDWHWDFGDGSTSTEENPVHTFNNSGVYPVSLTIRENDHFDGCVFVHIWNDPNFALSTKRVNVTVGGTDPTPYKPLAIPGRIEAEDYNLGGEGVAYHDNTAGNSGGAYRSDNVDIETQGGGTNVGWIRNGEYLTYTVNVTQPGQYAMTARVASPNEARTIALSVDGAPPVTIAVPNTGSFGAYATVGVLNVCPTPSPPLTPVWPPVQPGCLPIRIPLAAGTHTLKLAFAGDGQNLDWIEFVPVDQTPEPNGTTPYVNVTIPGTIEAEDYDVGGEDAAYHDTTVGNQGGAYRSDDVDVAAIPGGHAVVGIEDGEWLVYTIGGVAPTPQLPALVLYLGSDRDGGNVQLEVNGRVAGTVSVPNTGSATAFRAVQTQVQAAAGTLRLRFHGAGMGVDRIESPQFTSTGDNYNWANFTADPVNGPAPLRVRFTDTSSEFAYQWLWDFGDGATSAEQNPVHTFPSPGIYNVSLTIREADHWSGGGFMHIWNDLSHGKTVQVTVEGPGPVAGHAVPGTIQAEDYDLGGQNVGYSDTTTGNSGGAYRHDDVDIETAGGTTNVGWIREGEWLTYTADVASAGQYTLTARVASPNSGRTILVLVDNGYVATIAVPRTGSFSTWQTASVQVPLAAGQHTLRLMFTGDGQNIDWIAFGMGPTPPTTTTTTPVPSGGASFSAVPVSAPHGSAVKFTVTPAGGKTISAAWWSFDAPAHLNTWNSRVINPTFFYPSTGTFSPLVKLTYTDGSAETVQRTGYVRAT
jgi:PKD repeat protein